MAEYTSYLGLKKPAQHENYNVEDFNDNADLIDAEMEEQADGIGALQQTVDAHLADDAPHNMAYQHGSGHYIANNGYVKLPDGTIIQCANSGYITLTEAGIRSIDVLLPIVFPNAVGQAIAVVSHVSSNYTATVKIVVPFTNKVQVVVESEAQVIAISVIAIGW